VKIPHRVLGLEGTAWNLSAAVVDNHTVLNNVGRAYIPKSGGIHPREAAQYLAQNINPVLEELLCECDDFDGVAFSQGPGLGPCLRTVATAARALSLRFNVPLVGVNHCVAHAEIGLWRQPDACDPIVMYVSGANTQVLSLVDRRYKIFGETLDIGLGNALDKFARSAGLNHPGGPKVELLAKKSGGHVELPYIVKGMDLSFSGLATAATEALTSGTPLEDVCHSFQEVAFAMCVEVVERALAHTRRGDVLLAGGVGRNGRLKEMLTLMCEERGARFFVPEPEFLEDNGAMIAHTGRLMLAAGIQTPLDESGVRPGYRPDEVDITWH